MKKKAITFLVAAMCLLLTACSDSQETQQETAAEEIASEAEAAEDSAKGAPASEEAPEEPSPEETTVDASSEDLEQEAEGEEFVDPYVGENYYGRCVQFSKTEVENFAHEISGYFKAEDWNTLAEHIYFPIEINDTYYKDKEAFLMTDWSSVFTEEYKNQVASEAGTDMFNNWSGIYFGDIILNSIEQQLWITNIGYRSDVEKVVSDGIYGGWKMDADQTVAHLQSYSGLQDMFGTGIHGGTSFILNEDGTFIYSLALSEYYEGSFEENGDVITLNYTDMEQNQSSMQVNYTEEDGQMYLISQYDGESIYWQKLAEP